MSWYKALLQAAREVTQLQSLNWYNLNNERITIRMTVGQLRDLIKNCPDPEMKSYLDGILKHRIRMFEIHRKKKES